MSKPRARTIALIFISFAVVVGLVWLVVALAFQTPAAPARWCERDKTNEVVPDSYCESGNDPLFEWEYPNEVDVDVDFRGTAPVLPKGKVTRTPWPPAKQLTPTAQPTAKAVTPTTQPTAKAVTPTTQPTAKAVTPTTQPTAKQVQPTAKQVQPTVKTSVKGSGKKG